MLVRSYTETGNLLWLLVGYQVVRATLLTALGRLADVRGRVRIYNLGFLVFSIGSILLYIVPDITPQLSNTAVFELIIFRLVPGVGMVAALGGSLVGLLVSDLLSAINWRLMFLVSVPFGVIGTIWSYVSLREQSNWRASSRMNFLGNLFLAGGLAILTLLATLF